MALTALNHVLSSFHQSASPQPQQQLQQILDCWAQVVGAAVVAQTRPVSVQRQVLQVATSNPTWAQTLMFERQRILHKLNPHLSQPLTEIRFSTAQWHGTKSSPRLAVDMEATRVWQDHPSHIDEAHLIQVASRLQDAHDLKTVFRNWATLMQARGKSLPLCPQCRCPTPEGELSRWSLCSLCVAKTWAHHHPQG